MALPLVQPSGGTPTTKDFTTLQTLWARQLNGLLENYRGGVGQIVISALNVAQFQNQAGPGWVPTDGRNVDGSAYHALTGLMTIPTQAPLFSGGNLYIRIN